MVIKASVPLDGVCLILTVGFPRRYASSGMSARLGPRSGILYSLSVFFLFFANSHGFYYLPSTLFHTTHSISADRKLDGQGAFGVTASPS